MVNTQPPITDATVVSTTTPMEKEAGTNGIVSEDPPLFSTSLISPEVSESLPEGYTIRPLRRSDYYTGRVATAPVHVSRRLTSLQASFPHCGC